MGEEIIEHLKKRPIASLLRRIESESALKLLCIVDWRLQKFKLYEHIVKHPKLLEQLVCFRSYEQFHFYEYRMKKDPFGMNLLQCECCEFVAPYNITLEHMVLNHGYHRSARVCQWCRKMDIREHIESNTLDQCYREYMDQNKISVNSIACRLINEVFKILRSLAGRLQVLTQRQSNYCARTFARTDHTITIDDTDDEDSSNDNFITPRMRGKTMNSEHLNRLFGVAMHFFRVNVHSSPRNYIEPVAEIPKQHREKQQHPSLMEPSEQQPPMIQQMIQHVPQMPMQEQLEQHHYHPPLMTPMEQMSLLHALPPSYNAVRSVEITNLANFMTYAIENIRSDEIRKKALFDIQKRILQFSADDLRLQLENRGNDQ